MSSTVTSPYLSSALLVQIFSYLIPAKPTKSSSAKPTRYFWLDHIDLIACSLVSRTWRRAAFASFSKNVSQTQTLALPCDDRVHRMRSLLQESLTLGLRIPSVPRIAFDPGVLLEDEKIAVAAAYIFNHLGTEQLELWLFREEDLKDGQEQRVSRSSELEKYLDTIRPGLRNLKRLHIPWRSSLAIPLLKDMPCLNEIVFDLTFITDSLVSSLITHHAENIHILRVSDACAYSPQDLSAYDTTHIGLVIKLIRQLPNLSHLELIGIPPLPEYDNLLDAVIESSLHLETLRLDRAGYTAREWENATHYPSASRVLGVIKNSVHSLRRLNLTGHRAVDIHCLRTLCESAFSLEELSLGGCDGIRGSSAIDQICWQNLDILSLRADDEVEMIDAKGKPVPDRTCFHPNLVTKVLDIAKDLHTLALPEYLCAPGSGSLVERLIKENWINVDGRSGIYAKKRYEEL